MTNNQITGKVDYWFAKNYDILKEHISLRWPLDEDSYHEAYLKTREAPIDIENIQKVFFNNYQSIRKRNIAMGFVFFNPNELFFNMLPDKESETESKEQPDRSRLVYSIKQHVSVSYPPVWIAIWKCHTEKGFSIIDCQKMSGLSYNKTKSVISNINRCIREMFKYAT